MKLKLFKLILALSIPCVGFTYSVDHYQPSHLASHKKAAVKKFRELGYKLNDQQVKRQFAPTTGEGFWDSYVDLNGVKTRLVYWGKGEFIGPHSHDEEEKIKITSGECDFWKSFDGGKTWKKSHAKAGDLIIVAKNIPHCLVASNKVGATFEIPKNNIVVTIDQIEGASTPF